MFQTGIYADDCKVWRKKTYADKTSPAFKVFFTDANQDLRQSKATSESAGYHPASTIDLQRTLNTLTTTIESDQSTITNMTEHDNHLTKQLNQDIAGLGTATDNIATLQSQFNALTSSDSGRGDSGRGDGSGSGSRNSSSSVGAGVGTPKDKRHRFDFNREPKRKVYTNDKYCHTYGYHITDSHTSNTCLNPGTGHKKDATRTNTMGGYTRGASVCL